MGPMQLKTVARDCLSLNWALPKSAAPALPSLLRYETHVFGDSEYVFASALLFQFTGLHYSAVPFFRVGYPQFSLRLYVIDHKGRPSVLLLRILVPSWVAPFAQTLGRQPSEPARFKFPGLPDPAASSNGDEWHWQVERKASLELTGRLSAPPAQGGRRLGSWDETVAYFRHRRRVYAVWNQRLRALNTSHPASDVWPLKVDIKEIGLVAQSLPAVETVDLLRPHSAWICPEIPFSFEFGKPLTSPLAQQRWPAPESC